MTKPVQEIISREFDNDGLRDLLTKFSENIEDAVNFGSNILKWDAETAKGGDENIPIPMSLRHFIELIDAISILVRQSSIDPSKLLLRGALETYFGLEYLFEKDTVDRSMAFLVSHAHKNLKVYQKLDKTSDRSKELQSILQKDKTLGKMQIPNIPQVSSAIQITEKLLQRPEYKKAEEEFQRLKKAGETNPSWYRFYNGPKKIQGLADHLKLSGLYEILYRHWSGPTHGTDILQGKLNRTNNGVDIVQIRFPKDAQTIASYAMTLSIKAFKIYIDNRIPDKTNEFTNWYQSIRPFYLQVTSNQKLIKV